jgi:hypothetical protein
MQVAEQQKYDAPHMGAGESLENDSLAAEAQIKQETNLNKCNTITLSRFSQHSKDWILFLH